MPHFAKHDDEAYIVLDQVVTMKEAARRLGVSYRAIKYARDAGNIPAVQCGFVWLVYLPSASKWFNHGVKRGRPRKV